MSASVSWYELVLSQILCARCGQCGDYTGQTKTCRGLKRSVKKHRNIDRTNGTKSAIKSASSAPAPGTFFVFGKRGGLLKCKLASFRIVALRAHSGEVPCRQRRRAEPLCIYAKAVFRQAPSSLIGVLPHHTQLSTQGYYF